MEDQSTGAASTPAAARRGELVVEGLRGCAATFGLGNKVAFFDHSKASSVIQEYEWDVVLGSYQAFLSAFQNIFFTIQQVAPQITSHDERRSFLLMQSRLYRAELESYLRASAKTLIDVQQAVANTSSPSSHNNNQVSPLLSLHKTMACRNISVDDQLNQLKSIEDAKSLWHLFEIFHIDPHLNVTAQLVDWMHRSVEPPEYVAAAYEAYSAWTASSSSSSSSAASGVESAEDSASAAASLGIGEELVARLGPGGQVNAEQYWTALYQLLAVGRAPDAVFLLSLNEDLDLIEPGLRDVLVNVVQTCPSLAKQQEDQQQQQGAGKKGSHRRGSASDVGSGSVDALTSDFNEWHTGVAGLLARPTLASAHSVTHMLRLLCGSETELARAAGSWQEMMLGMLLYTKPFATKEDVAYMMSEAMRLYTAHGGFIASVTPASSSSSSATTTVAFDACVRAIITQDAVVALRICDAFVEFRWFAAHLADLVAHVYQMQLSIPQLIQTEQALMRSASVAASNALAEAGSSSSSSSFSSGSTSTSTSTSLAKSKPTSALTSLGSSVSSISSISSGRRGTSSSSDSGLSKSSASSSSSLSSSSQLSPLVLDHIHDCGAPEDLREHYIVEHATGLIHTPLWQCAIVYFEHCPKIGANYVSLVLTSRTFPTVAATQQALAICERHGLVHEHSTLCSALSMHELRARRTASAIVWALRAKTPSRVTAMCELLLTQALGGEDECVRAKAMMQIAALVSMLGETASSSRIAAIRHCYLFQRFWLLRARMDEALEERRTLAARLGMYLGGARGEEADGIVNETATSGVREVVNPVERDLELQESLYAIMSSCVEVLFTLLSDAPSYLVKTIIAELVYLLKESQPGREKFPQPLINATQTSNLIALLESTSTSLLSATAAVPVASTVAGRLGLDPLPPYKHPLALARFGQLGASFVSRTLTDMAAPSQAPLTMSSSELYGASGSSPGVNMEESKRGLAASSSLSASAVPEFITPAPSKLRVTVNIDKSKLENVVFFSEAYHERVENEMALMRQILVNHLAYTVLF